MKPKGKHAISRRDRFIDNGGDAFLPLSRIREIRWEEAVIRSRIAREGGGGDVTFRHVHFHCRSGCCLGDADPGGGGPRAVGGPRAGATGIVTQRGHGGQQILGWPTLPG